MSETAPLTLGVVAEGAADGAWLDGIDFAAAGIRTVFLRPAGAEGPALHGSGSPVPDFAGLVRGLEREGAEAVFVPNASGIVGRLTTVAADALSIPVFTLLATVEDLANAGRRVKPRPDLFFIADKELLPAALADPRYGSTLLPTGHPARDLALRSGGGGPWDDRRYGDGGAAPRILAAIDAWRRGALDPPIPELSIIVPAYKEAKNLPVVCSRLLAMLEASRLAAEIILVDDTSPDDTYAVALEQMWRSPRIRALTKPTPRGMGNGIRYGLRQSRADIVAVTMGDGSDEVEKIPEMLGKVRDEGYGLAIGCRYRRRENFETVPWLYRFWSRTFRLTTLLVLGFDLKDYTNAFRVYHKRIFARYGPESGGFEISPEITFKAWFATHRIAEVDVRHLKRASGQSSFSFLRAGPGYGKILTKAFVRRLTGRWFVLDW